MGALLGVPGTTVVCTDGASVPSEGVIDESAVGTGFVGVAVGTPGVTVGIPVGRCVGLLLVGAVVTGGTVRAVVAVGAALMGDDVGSGDTPWTVSTTTNSVGNGEGFAVGPAVVGVPVGVLEGALDGSAEVGLADIGEPVGGSARPRAGVDSMVGLVVGFSVGGPAGVTLSNDKSVRSALSRTAPYTISTPACSDGKTAFTSKTKS